MARRSKLDTRLRGYDGGRETKRGKLDTRLRGYDGGGETKRGQIQNKCSDPVLVMRKFLDVLSCPIMCSLRGHITP